MNPIVFLTWWKVTPTRPRPSPPPQTVDSNGRSQICFENFRSRISESLMQNADIAAMRKTSCHRLFSLIPLLRSATLRRRSIVRNFREARAIEQVSVRARAQCAKCRLASTLYDLLVNLRNSGNKQHFRLFYRARRRGDYYDRKLALIFPGARGL